MRTLMIVVAAGVVALGWNMAMGAVSEADRLAEEIKHRVERELNAVVSSGQPASVQEFEQLAEPGSWTEIWPNANGGDTSRKVEGLIWNAPIQAALAKHGAVRLPKRDKPYYLSEPIVLKSGQRLYADPSADIRLLPNTNTCLVRNERLVSGQKGPIPPDTNPDVGIVVEGGIWTTLATGPKREQWNGNELGRSAKQGGVPNCHGAIVMSNVRGVVVRNLTIRQVRAHGVQLSNCHEFLVEGVTFDEHRRDGVHVHGPASYGVIRNIRGVTGDDFIALNAWDWKNTSPCFGPIDHVLIEQIYGDYRGMAEIRLLPGVKNFADRKLDCSIANCVFRDLHDLRTIKIYDQPNLELGRDKDFSDPIGSVRNVYFCKLAFAEPGRFQIAVNVDGLLVDDVQLKFDVSLPAHKDFIFVEIGPMSETFKCNPQDPSTWVELFSPDRDVTVRGFRLTNVRSRTVEGFRLLPGAEARLVKAADQKLNPDYPKTTPRGGVGKVNWE